MSLDQRRLERIARILEEITKPPRDVEGHKHVLHWSRQFAYTGPMLELFKIAGSGSCVYEVWEPRDDLWTAVYVGETDRLGQRLEEHMGKQEKNPHLRQADFSRLAFS